ncbi:hypothetical protein CGC20_5745 [Leishmania donovani]|uniref:Uncharacterized protein n=1 Tax=Leishmania donovani TaxID=5661 RepID=A0A504XSZ6_LEIDO|nr:hypothetical protein CGC21_32585 [Leishmania donovani]TPP52132.1 hypothetical protein CGC20_5745 [Leishmania donovani]
MNSAARAWLSVRRNEQHKLHDGTAAQVERLHVLIGGASRLAVVSGGSALSLRCQLATAAAPVRVAGANMMAAQLANAQSALRDEERTSRSLLLQEEADARITILCSVLHCVLRTRYAGENDGDACNAVDDHSSLSSMAPTLHAPTPFASRDVRR